MNENAPLLLKPPVASSPQAALITNSVTTAASSTTTAAAALPSSTWEMVQQGGVVMDLNGSTARDHLANERTFLAWIRTALALVGVGLGLLKITSISYVAGYAVIALGVFTLLNASWRYFHILRLLTQRQFQPNVISILSMVTMILLVTVVFVYLSLTGQLMRHENDGPSLRAGTN